MVKKDINEASREDLLEIPQMSSARAETIIHYREQHGDFTDIRQISKVPGIGETMASQIGEYFEIGRAMEGSAIDRSTDSEIESVDKENKSIPRKRAAG